MIKNNDCPNCHFKLNNNNEVTKVLKMIQNRKRSNDERDYPMLICDFICKKCDTHKIIKWNNCLDIKNIEFCEKCKTPLEVSIFLGKMEGFTLQSYCLSCYKKLKSGKIGGIQK